MIAIAPGSGFLIYLILMLAALCAVGAWEMWRARIQHWSVSEEQLTRCAKCGYSFLVRRSETVVRCPRCEKLCSIRKK